MKLALLLPGYIESPDYRHLVIVDNRLKNLGYTTIRVDPCSLWQNGDSQNYTTTNYIVQIKELIDSYLPKEPTEIILIGHSLGALVALVVGNMYEKATKIICLSPPVRLDNSDHKWINGFRTSKKDLPNNASEFRGFIIPYSFAEDRKKYSMITSVKNNKKPLSIIMGANDPSFTEFKTLSNNLNLSNFIEIEGMNHDFRQSEEFCNKVATEIEKLLTK